jgi:hypothetical protein
MAMSKSKEQAPMGQMKALSRQHLARVWQKAKSGAKFRGEDARLVKALRDHPEYADIWDYLGEPSYEEIEIDGVNPILHIMAHQTVQNQLAQDYPKEVRPTIEKLMQQGYPRHEAIHAVGSLVMDEIWHVMKQKRPFDEARYQHGLRELTKE